MRGSCCDAPFAAKVADVVGLYLDPPGGVVVLAVDEKTQIQALDRAAPMLPLDFGRTAKRTHDYTRHDTTNLFAALKVATGEAVGSCRPSRDGREFPAFLKKATAPRRGREIHVVLDNLSTHTTPGVAAWLERNPAGADYSSALVGATLLPEAIMPLRAVADCVRLPPRGARLYRRH